MVVGEEELFRLKIRRRPRDCQVAPTISTDYRNHDQTEFPIPTGGIDTISFAMRAVKDKRGKFGRIAETSAQEGAPFNADWSGMSKSVCGFGLKSRSNSLM